MQATSITSAITGLGTTTKNTITKANLLGSSRFWDSPLFFYFLFSNQIMY